MKVFDLLLRFVLVFLAFTLLFKIGFRFLFWLFHFWYISIPLVIAFYLLFVIPKKKRNTTARPDDLDPSKEIKLDSEPEIRDLGSEEEGEKDR